MSDQSIVEVTQADVTAAKVCWNALADADNDWDALSVDEQVAISESFARHRIAEREACAMVADEAEESCDRATEAADTTELKDKRSFGADVASDIAAAIRARS